MPERRPWSRRRGTVLGAVAILVGGGAVAAYASTGSGSSPSWVTTTVARGDVHQLSYFSGTVGLVAEVTAAFPVSGIVRTVTARPGQTVAKGQSLATLRPAPLQTALLSARSTLASAQATLATDEASAAAPVTTTTGATSHAPSSSAKALTTDTAAEKKAVAAEAKACAGVVPAGRSAPAKGAGSSSARPHDEAAARPSEAPGPSGAAPASTQPTQPAQPAQATQPTQAAASTSAATGPTVAQLTACATALGRVQGAQAAVTQDQTQLSRQLSSTSTSGGTGSTRSNTSGASGATAQSVQAAAIRVITDKAAVTAAQAAVTTAQKNLDATKLTAPLSGVVQSVDLAAGAAANASSGVVIVGAGAAKVTLDVPLATLKQLKVGESAPVTPDGATRSVPGTISSLGLLASTASTTTTYPVVVSVPHPPTTLSSGSVAGVSVELSTAHDVLTVPSSALTPLANGTAIASVLSGGRRTSTRVTTGAVGAVTTEVKSGLKQGDVVVLADPGQALPASSATLTRATVFGGFGGAGTFPGGFRGGAGTLRRSGTG